MRAAAKAHAKNLGPITRVEPTDGFNEFGEPRLGVDQVLVTKTGTTFHRGWCRIVVDIDDPTRFTVIRRDTVGARRLCLVCRDEGPLR
ncbi:MAG TPA: hypothetical protein P5544_14805 [Candidatus Nanopelagicales bacterium]|nr:hypothetical protein [Candidatus Nanopelagicales bacterium]